MPCSRFRIASLAVALVLGSAAMVLSLALLARTRAIALAK